MECQLIHIEGTTELEIWWRMAKIVGDQLMEHMMCSPYKYLFKKYLLIAKRCHHLASEKLQQVIKLPPGGMGHIDTKGLLKVPARALHHLRVGPAKNAVTWIQSKEPSDKTKLRAVCKITDLHSAKLSRLWNTEEIQRRLQTIED